MKHYFDLIKEAIKTTPFRLLIFIGIVLCNIPVYAQSINSDSYSQKDTFNNSSRYDFTTSNTLGNDMSLLSVGSIGTRYNGKSYYFQFNFHKSLTANKIYELKVSSTTSDFTSNINKDDITPLCYSSFAYNFNTKECGDISVISVIRGSGNQSKDFTIRFSPLSSMTYWGFKFGGGFNALTGVSNFLINNFDLTEVNADNTDEIINNNNQNTQNVIDNQNQNTQDIINNQNSLLGDRCSNLLDYNNYYHNENSSSININGDTIVLSSNYTWSHLDYNITTQVGKTYYISGSTSSTNETALVWVGNDNSNFNERYFIYENNGSFSGSFVATTTHTYIRLYASKTTANTINYYRIMFSEFNRPYCAYGSTISKLDDTNNAISDTNSYLKDNSNPNISDNEFLSVFNSIGFTDPLQHLLQLPVQFINALVSQSNTCQTINLGTLWGVSLTLPCINLENIIGSNVWGIIDILMSIGLLVVIVKNLYQTFANLMTMGGEKEAREKFSMPTPMEFLSMILGGDR